MNPWNEYPHIWKTKAAFFAYLRGALRRAVWEKWPGKIEFKNESCTPPPEGIETRAKTGAYCSLSGEWEGKSKLEVDHIEGNVSLKDWDDVVPFIQHLCASKDNLQLVTKEAHKIKSYAERMGITYEEAVVEKQIIQICKTTASQISFLTEKGIVPATNAAKRKQQIREILR